MATSFTHVLFIFVCFVIVLINPGVFLGEDMNNQSHWCSSELCKSCEKLKLYEGF